VLVLVLGLLLQGCAVTGIAFRQDDRLSFVTPDDRAEVTLPFTVEWETEDFDVPADGSYAVFVDRAPQPPGKTLEWLARNDDSCRTDDGCPDEAWFTERDVFPTTETEITIERLPARADDRRERHEITVVLLDRDGVRVAETGWTLEVEVTRG
jgi:hypothetical protein